MKIGIIGSGNIGANAARLFVRAGHEVAISNSRGAESLKDLVAELGANAKATTIEDAAQFGEAVLVAIPFGKYNTLPAPAFKGKIVIDATNYYPARDGNFPDLDADQTASSELLASYLTGTRIVKAFNTINAQYLATQGNPNLSISDRRAIFIAGDDADAKAVVANLIEDIGFAAVDMGTLHDSRKQQPNSAVYWRRTSASARIWRF